MQRLARVAHSACWEHRNLTHGTPVARKIIHKNCSSSALFFRHPIAGADSIFAALLLRCSLLTKLRYAVLPNGMRSRNLGRPAVARALAVPIVIATVCSVESSVDRGEQHLPKG